MKRILLILTFMLILPPVSYCQTAKEKMGDSLARAYKSASEKKMDEAKNFFRKGMQYAKEANSWQGLIDSGYGLSTLGLTEEAKTAFDDASLIVTQNKDWHGAAALGYAYASLPRQTVKIESAVQMWDNAKTWSRETDDWAGLLEAGRGLISISKNKEAEECLDMAKGIVKEMPTEQAIKTLVSAYRKLGKEDKAVECASFRPQAQAPPPGWQPTAGESVRGTKTVAPEIQQAQRESIDKDIEAKRQWEQQDEQRRHEEKMQKQELAYQAYRDYLMYYSYPYYGNYGGYINNYDDYYLYSWTTQPVWAVRTADEICNWGLWNYGRYTNVNGFYIAVDFD